MPPSVYRAISAVGVGLFLLAVGSGFRIATKPDTPRPVAAVRPVRVMVVGDSITQGRDGGEPWRCEFYRLAPRAAPVDMVGIRSDLYVSPGKFASHYPDPVCDRDHSAKWGLLISGAKQVIAAQVDQARPNVLIVLLGINDLNHKQPVATVEADYRSFLSNARAVAPGLDIIVGTVLPTDHVVDQTLIDTLNQWLADNSAALGVRLARTAEVVDPVADLYDNVHPTSYGAHKLALAFLAAR